jgi:pimeloyl-ACP methyl ester carboxylesterase
MLRILTAIVLTITLPAFAGADVWSDAKHGTVDSSGVKIHYATMGSGPVVVMIHGFPDFWYSWRDQMEALSANYQVVAIDQRGYNLSDKPKGVENYDLSLLVGDVAAVIKHLGRDKAIIVGHDWGGIVAWTLSMMRPDMVEKLIILNLPHPKGLRRELATNPQQQQNSQYARNFQKEGAHNQLTAEGLSRWVTDPEARKKYIEAFNRSDFEAMLNYYKRNYPAASGEALPEPPPMPKVTAPVLLFHGLDDFALHRNGLSGTWDWVDKDLTLVTVPGAGHFVQQDAADLVTSTMRWWLRMRVQK